MEVLVTGGTGFLGRHVVHGLARAGHRVRVLVRPTSWIEGMAANNVQLITCGLDHLEALAKAATGVQVVVHLAGLVKAVSEEDFYRINAAAAGRMALAASRTTSVRRFVLVSSQAALGPSDGPHPLPPDAPRRPVSAYGRSKAAGEDSVLQVATETGLPVTIIRPPAVYGPWDKEILLLFRLIHRFRIMPVLGHGDGLFSLIHAFDCGRAIVAAVEGEECHPPRVVLGVSDGHTHGWRQFGEAVAGCLGLSAKPVVLSPWMFRGAGFLGEVLGRLSGKPVKMTRDTAREMEQRYWLISHREAVDLLPWSPTVLLEEGVEVTARWYSDQGWL